MVRWLLETFALDDGSHHRVLDVAGGKGELAARLALCHGMTVMLVDPRTADIASAYIRDVVPRLPRSWRDRIQDRCQSEPNYIQSMVDERFRQLVLYFTDETVVNDSELKSAIEECTLIIGMHADSATECIVDVALLHRKPFVVVPCCVFPNLFNQRYLIHETDGETKKTAVRNCEQFLEYLLLKDRRLQTCVLPFDGRNVAIWWDGKD